MPSILDYLHARGKGKTLEVIMSIAALVTACYSPVTSVHFGVLLKVLFAGSVISVIFLFLLAGSRQGDVSKSVEFVLVTVLASAILITASLSSSALAKYQASVGVNEQVSVAIAAIVLSFITLGTHVYSMYLLGKHLSFTAGSD